MKRTDTFMNDTTRYDFDGGLCRAKSGYAQFDTCSDASYFGSWLNPFTRVFFTFAEGDCIRLECESDQEFVAEVNRQMDWHDNRGDGFKGIDPGFDKDLESKLKELGLMSRGYNARQEAS